MEKINRKIYDKVLELNLLVNYDPNQSPPGIRGPSLEEQEPMFLENTILILEKIVEKLYFKKLRNE